MGPILPFTEAERDDRANRFVSVFKGRPAGGGVPPAGLRFRTVGALPRGFPRPPSRIVRAVRGPGQTLDIGTARSLLL